MLLVAEAKLPSSKEVTPSTITHLFRSTVFGFTSTSPYRDALDLLSGMSHILAEIDLEEPVSLIIQRWLSRLIGFR